MSENKPQPHPRVRLWDDNKIGLLNAELNDGEALTPDQAVALGYALFEHGLALKGRMKPPPTEGTKNEH